jgi:hypothetical protein
MRSTIILPLALTFSLAVANPLALTKRWSCGGPGNAYSCEPLASCKNVDAWSDCAFQGLESCVPDPTPSHSSPVSSTQGSSQERGNLWLEWPDVNAMLTSCSWISLLRARVLPFRLAVSHTLYPERKWSLERYRILADFQ